MRTQSEFEQLVKDRMTVRQTALRFRRGRVRATLCSVMIMLCIGTLLFTFLRQNRVSVDMDSTENVDVSGPSAPTEKTDEPTLPDTDSTGKDNSDAESPDEGNSANSDNGGSDGVGQGAEITEEYHGASQGGSDGNYSAGHSASYYGAAGNSAGTSVPPSEDNAFHPTINTLRQDIPVAVIYHTERLNDAALCQAVYDCLAAVCVPENIIENVDTPLKYKTAYFFLVYDSQIESASVMCYHDESDRYSILFYSRRDNQDSHGTRYRIEKSDFEKLKEILKFE